MPIIAMTVYSYYENPQNKPNKDEHPLFQESPLRKHYCSAPALHAQYPSTKEWAVGVGGGRSLHL